MKLRRSKLTLAGTFITCLLISSVHSQLRAADAGPMKLGIFDPLRGESKYNVEFLRFDRMVPVYREHGLEPALMETRPFVHAGKSAEEIYQLLKPYHVVALFNTYDDSLKLTPELKAMAPNVNAALTRYVSEGGGLVILPQGLRYPSDDDIRYWNLVFEGLAFQILPEGVFDPTRSFSGKDIEPATYWYTQNIREHPVTAGVKRLVLPLHPAGKWAGVSAIKYAPEWTLIVSGEREARSFQCGTDNAVKLDRPGSYENTPPVVAWRTLEKGRIVCFPLANVHAGLNYNVPIWDNTVETRGNKAADLPSDTLKLLLNAYRWTGEPALSNPELGSHVNVPYQEIQYPATVEWDSNGLNNLTETACRGMIGAVSSHAGGRGSVLEYVQAAQSAGLQFIVFADPLEKLNPDALDQLKKECAAASAAGDFYACPGVEFSDGLDNRWVVWGEKITFPEQTFSGQYGSKEVFEQWDGQRVRHFGQYMHASQFPPCALLDYKQLRAAGAHPENLWWFYDYFPLVYRNNKLVADNYSEFLHGMSDLRWVGLASFTGIESPDKVAAAAGACFSGFKDLTAARNLLNARCAPIFQAIAGQQFVSQGPSIHQWEVLNFQMESHWKKTRGAQRVRAKFCVSSPEGIAEVKIYDGDRGVFRRFLGGGEKQVTREFECVQDKQHYLTLEVTDRKGKRAFSWMTEVYCYKQGLHRCGDNLNILGATGMVWMPDRNHMMPMAKQFENGLNFTAFGWDSSGYLFPLPRSIGEDQISTVEYGDDYPQFNEGTVGKILEVPLGSHSIQIATQKMTKLSQNYDRQPRPGPAICTVPRDLGPLQFFERTHTIYAPATGTDFYTAWNHRRAREAAKDYRGGLIWHEGKIKFTQDVTLKGNVPIKLLRMTCPLDQERGWGNLVVIDEGNGDARMSQWTSQQTPVRFSGQIGAGGYASVMPAAVGYEGFLSPLGNTFSYEVSLPDRGITIGLGKEGQLMKAGTEVRYQYAVGSFADTRTGNELLKDTSAALNLKGGRDGYPVKMKSGQLKEEPFFCTVQAEKNEAAFQIGPRELIIDLPFRILGVEDNGCAAVYTSGRPWFDFVAVAEGAAWFQEPVSQGLDLWVGNVLVCENKSVKVTLVVDGQKEGRTPFAEFHNPTDKAVTTTVFSPPNTPQFGGLKEEVTIPAGNSVRFTIDGKQLKKSTSGQLGAPSSR